MDVLVQVFKNYTAFKMSIKFLYKVSQLLLWHIFVIIKITFCRLVDNGIPNVLSNRSGNIPYSLLFPKNDSILVLTLLCIADEFFY